MATDPRLKRLSSTNPEVVNDLGIDAKLFASEDVPVESAAVSELLAMLRLRRTVDLFADSSPDSFASPPAIERVAVTSDFHKAAGTPVGTVLATRGFVVPAAVGNDINFGMRVHVTDLPAEEVARELDRLETVCRRMYFEAGRNIPMSRAQREAMFRSGLLGLLDAVPKRQKEGLWELFHKADLEGELTRVDQCGNLPAGRVHKLDDFLGPKDCMSRDCQIGSIGVYSASYGAGRALSRGDAAKGHDDEFRRILSTFRVVTPLDLRRPDVQMRRDIVEKKLAELKQEAPHAYKGIGPIVETLSRAGIARPVAELSPLMTIKG